MKRLAMILGSLVAMECLGMLVLPEPVGVAEAKGLSFRTHIWPTIRSYCSNCHRPKYKGKGKDRKLVTPGDLDLKTWDLAYKNMVNIQSKQAQEGYNIVTPSDPSLSYLYFKLTGDHKNPNVKGKGKPMPLKKKQLAAWRINQIVKWIQQGAKK